MRIKNNWKYRESKIKYVDNDKIYNKRKFKQTKI